MHSGSRYVIDYRSSFGLGAPPAEVWDAMGHPELFEAWWSWLGEFSIVGPGLVEGAELHGVVSPPVPYRMRLAILLERCLAPRRIDAVVHGDLEGRAALVLEPEGAGTRAEVSWRIEMMQAPMRLAARVARPLLTWGHDRVVDVTVNSFRRQLARTERSRSALDAEHRSP